MKLGLNIKRAVWGLLMLSTLSVSAAQPLVKESVDSLLGGVSVLFPKASADLDAALGANARHLRSITSWLDSVMACDTLRIASITFSGSASPDGATSFNADLALRRAQALERYIRARVQLPDSVVHLQGRGVDWQALAEYVRDSDLKGRDRVLDIIQNRPEMTYSADGLLIDSRRKRLMDMDGGRTWHEMEARWFPYMRSASLMVGVRSQKPAEPATATDPATPYKSYKTYKSYNNSPEPSPFYMSVQTNMLYDVLLLPTLGAEFYLGKGWSLAGNWTYGWWSSNHRHRYWRAYGGYLAARKWFGPAAKRKPLTGHHAGLYAQLLTYDIEFGGEGQMAGTPGEPLWHNPSYAFGLEYGYSLPISKRLNIDFTIGVGYLGGKYYKYRPVDGHYVWQGTHRRNYFGPTNAQISLVWLIGRGNTNAPKGGAR